MKKPEIFSMPTNMKTKTNGVQDFNHSAIDSICDNFRILEEKVQEHKRLLDAALPAGTEKFKGNEASEVYSDLNYKHSYKKMLVETIADLEATRKAFKSKQVETLRKKLIIKLSEID